MKQTDRFFFICGLGMVFSEILKQLCLTFQLNHGHYQWWYFPFQLCSIPMYLCVLLPFVRTDSLRRFFLTFLMTFGLIGGFFAFFDTSGMHYPVSLLTAHSYLWHVLLVIIGIKASRHPFLEHTFAEYLGALSIYLFCCMAATALNIALFPCGVINLFYISPLYKMNQLVFRDIAEAFGNRFAIASYIFATALGAYLVFLASSIFYGRKKRLP